MKFSLDTVARIITENTEEGIYAEVKHIYEDYGAGLMWDTIIVSRVKDNGLHDSYQALNGPLQKKLKNCEDVKYSEIEELINDANRLLGEKKEQKALTKLYQYEAKNWDAAKDSFAEFDVEKIKELYDKGDIESASYYWKQLYELFNDTNEFEQLNAYTKTISDQIVYDVTDYLKGYFTAEWFREKQRIKKETTNG